MMLLCDRGGVAEDRSKVETMEMPVVRGVGH